MTDIDTDTASIFDELVSELEDLHKTGKLKAINHIAVGTALLSELCCKRKVVNDAEYTAAMNGYQIVNVPIQVTGIMFFFTVKLDEKYGGFEIDRTTKEQLLQPVILDKSED